MPTPQDMREKKARPMSKKCTPKPLDKKLYAQVKKDVKSRVKRWPSAYASGQLVSEYKRRGGKYDKSCPVKSTGLYRWFEEEDWRNICTKGLPKCGRPKTGQTESKYRRAYPKCRPYKVAKQMSMKERKASCARKRRAVKAQPKSSKKVVRVK